jgi:hypothetical protein
LQRLALPKSAQIDDGEGETPLEFLFTDNGADIYSAIPTNPPNGSVWFFQNGIRVVIVYQDESARQQAIRNLSQSGVVAKVMDGSSAHGSLDNLKFAVVHLGVGSSQDKPDQAYLSQHHSAQESYLRLLVTGGWHVEGIQYYEPPSCSVPKTALCQNQNGRLTPCVLPGLPADSSEPNWITNLNVRERIESYGDPQFVRIVAAMKTKLKTRFEVPQHQQSH